MRPAGQRQAPAALTPIRAQLTLRPRREQADLTSQQAATLWPQVVAVRTRPRRSPRPKPNSNLPQQSCAGCDMRGRRAAHRRARASMAACSQPVVGPDARTARRRSRVQIAKNLNLKLGSPAPAHCGQPDCLNPKQAPFDWCGPRAARAGQHALLLAAGGQAVPPGQLLLATCTPPGCPASDEDRLLRNACTRICQDDCAASAAPGWTTSSATALRCTAHPARPISWPCTTTAARSPTCSGAPERASAPQDPAMRCTGATSVVLGGVR